MNTNKTYTKLLRKKIFTAMKEHIESKDVCLLDLPNYYNPGDQLIWEGEEELLKKMRVRIKYRASYNYFNPKMISEDDCILLQGGGNFGDLYPLHQRFKESIVKNFPKNRIIILSSTVHFSDKENLHASVKVFSEHSDVILFARDKESFKLLKKHFKNNKTYLIPDTAFAITNLKKVAKKSKDKKVLFLLRTDDEKGLLDKNSLEFINNLYISDWDTYTQNSIGGRMHWWSTNINKVILRLCKLVGHWNPKHDIYGLIKVHKKEHQIETAVNFLSQYDLVIVTRLHGHILAYILGIPNIVLDNSYGKNKNFYDTWVNKDSKNTYFANSVKEVRKIINNNFPEFLK